MRHFLGTQFAYVLQFPQFDFCVGTQFAKAEN